MMTLTRVLLLSLLVMFFTSRTAHAEDFGVGLMVGEPTGLSAQFGIGRLGALNGAVGLDLLNDRDVYVHLDYIAYLVELSSSRSLTVPFYVGVGGFVVTKNDLKLGARVPFGVQLDFGSAPIHIFAEIAARLQLIDKVHLGAGGALGFRYFF